MNNDDLEQAAYLRGWRDRPKGDIWTGVVIGVPVGMLIAVLIGVVG